MTTNSEKPADSRALDTLTELWRDAVEHPTAPMLDQGLKGLFVRISAGRARRRRLGPWLLVGVTTVACSLVVLQFASVVSKHPVDPAPTAPMLAYQIEGGSVVEGGYLRESGRAGIKLQFNEGSQFEFQPGTRGQIRTMDKEGARVAIERGTASFQVTPSSTRRWLVEVGPFVVTVKGTVFTVAWDPLSEEFELSLRRGRVVVSGPVSGGDVALRAGQRLVVNLAKAEALISEERTEGGAGEAVGIPSPAVAPPAERPPVVKDKPAASNARAALAPVAKVEGERGWADELARGHWDRILEDVKRAGLEAALNQASSEDLFALADAARYRRRADLARAALLAERRRFPGAARDLEAVFLLGRVEESRERGPAKAIAWYNEYLTRAPTGNYAAEALGRKMTLATELGGPTLARPIAEEYLRRFPRGSYAGSARALRSVP